MMIMYLYAITVSAVTINGVIVLEEHLGSDTCLIEVNEQKSRCDSLGNFSIKVKQNSVYALTITANNFYTSYQTFSDYELNELSNKPTKNIYSIPPITLVEKIKGRTMFAFAGDVMMGRRYSKPYFNDPILIGKENKLKDTKAVVQYMKSYLELADFSALNLETPISSHKPTKRAPKGVTFHSPPEALEALKWAGIDYVTLGNNHIYDYLEEGLLSTLELIKKSGLGFSGAGANQKQALRPYIKNLAGHEYAMLGYVGWTGSAKPNQVAEVNKGGSAFGTEQNIAQAVADQQRQGRATIVQYHGSLEYRDEPSGMTESRLKMAIDKGADLAIAHHPHVTQGFEIYKGKLIAYSMGNFIFDQNFHVTPLSYVLYVWMDGEKFHRAEIVPIYIKGYVPVPATGIQRNSIVKRVTNLTSRRNLLLTKSGGHLVLERPDLSQKPSVEMVNTTLTFDKNSRIADLYSFPTKQILSVTANRNIGRYRLGINQINGGDFESYNLFSSAERGWKLENAKTTIDHAYTGENSIAVTINNNETSVVGMKAFRRVFTAGSPMSYSAKILNKNESIGIRLYLQKRKTRAKFFDALKSKKTLLGEQIIKPSQNWQSIEFDFNLPRVGYRSYRVLLELSYKSKTKKRQLVYLDDVALIEWQAHFNEMNELPTDHELLSLSTHIGLENISKKNRMITLGASF